MKCRSLVAALLGMTRRRIGGMGIAALVWSRLGLKNEPRARKALAVASQTES
jgi:hypothetical protein